MRKIRMDRKGLSGMVAVIVLLTLVLVLGAIIAGTLSGAPRPVMPAVTAVNLTTEYGGNPAAGDYILVIRHEYGQPIADARVLDNVNPITKFYPDFPYKYSNWGTMELKINGKTTPAFLLYLSVEGKVKVNLLDSDMNLILDPTKMVWPKTKAEAGPMDFAKGDMMVVGLFDPTKDYPLPIPLQSSDLVQLVWVPRDLMLVEYLVQ